MPFVKHSLTAYSILFQPDVFIAFTTVELIVRHLLLYICMLRFAVYTN